METVKWVTLNASNPWILGIEVYRVSKKPARTFKGEWRKVIYTKRGLRVQMRKEALFIGWDR